MTEKSLLDQAGSFWTRNTKLNHEGLVLLDKLIQRVASIDCDKDALTRFVARSGADQNKVGRIIQAAFGKDLTFKKDATKATGGVMSHSWHGPDGYVLKNSYNHVVQAIADKKPFNDKELQKTLAPVKGAKMKKDVTADMQTAKAKAIARSLLAAKEEGFDVGPLMREIEALLAAAKKPSELVAKQVVNGVTVYEPKF